jgi:hypothetical protein
MRSGLLSAQAQQLTNNITVSPLWIAFRIVVVLMIFFDPVRFARA